MSEHTLKPWVVDLKGPFTLGGDMVAVEALSPDGETVTREVCTLLVDTDDWPDGPQWREDAANARLIAAAPDLIEACREALCHFYEHPRWPCPECGRKGPEEMKRISRITQEDGAEIVTGCVLCNSEHIRDGLRAAIRKAETGEQT